MESLEFEGGVNLNCFSDVIHGLPSIGNFWKNVVKIGKFDPSSRICSKCGSIKHDLKLSDKTYHRDICGLTMDRDHNASKNIKKIGLIKVGLVQPEFTPVEIATSGLYGIYPYMQMSVVESGSSEAFAEG